MSARRIVGREDAYDEPAAKRFSLHHAPSEDLKAKVAMKVERSINEDPFCFLSTVFLGAVPFNDTFEFPFHRVRREPAPSLTDAPNSLQFTQQRYSIRIGEMCSVRYTFNTSVN